MKSAQLPVTFCVVGISPWSDTKIGMFAKTKMQTVRNDQLSSIFFARDPKDLDQEMQRLCAELQSSVAMSVNVRVSLPAALRSHVRFSDGQPVQSVTISIPADELAG